MPLGTRGLQVVEAMVRQTGNGGSRDLLMLWTVWSGQLQPLGQIEVRKEQGTERARVAPGRSARAARGRSCSSRQTRGRLDRGHLE